jgi:predicted dehydrogenase
MKLAHVGLGYWGPNLLRNWNNLGVVVAAFDLDHLVLNKYAKQYPNIHFDSDWTTCLGRKDVDAISIATPPNTHYTLALEALKEDKHVFVEKPMTLEVAHAEELCEVAKKKKKMLMVGHTFLYSPEIVKLKEIIHAKDFGEILYIYSNRLNLGKIQTSANVIEDLAPHDMSIINYLIESSAVRVQAFGKCHILEDVEDVAFINIEYANGVTANFHLSWLDPLKKRKTVVVGSGQMAICDSGEAEIFVYNKGVELNIRGQDYANHILSYRYGDVVIPYFDTYEPLTRQCETFIEAVMKNTKTDSDGEKGLEVVKTMVAAQQSLLEDGAWILM